MHPRIPDTRKRRACFDRQRNGLTVVEVLFAMVVVLVGLVGVALMVPFAIRQAEDSYKITQGLAAGENAIGVLRSDSVVQPRIEAPWLFIGDNASVTPVTSLTEFYFNLYSSTTWAANTPEAVKRNELIGAGICIDPLFWGHQTTFVGTGNFAKTRFPFFNEIMPANYDPLGPLNSGTVVTPRLRRISLSDPSAPLAAARWLRLPASLKLATVAGSDLIQAKPDSDNSAPPLRGLYADSAGSLVQSAADGGLITWFATLTPVDETPVLYPETIAASSTLLPFAPESFNLSVAVVARRDVRDLNLDATTGIPVTGIVPTSERIGFLTDDTGTMHVDWNSGSFDIEIKAHGNTDPKLKVGDWIMLSRSTNVQYGRIPNANGGEQPLLANRQRHKWYRIIGVSGDNAFPRVVRVVGEPWYWTEHELQIIRRYPNIPRTFPVTAVTLVRDVVQVHERIVNLGLN